MIKYIPHKNLNIKKYDQCVEQSVNSRIYAFSWYLNIVTDDWDVLVLNDYEAVMPLPKRRKYMLNYIYQAPWVQQLGVFSDKDISEKLIKEFLKEIPVKFVIVEILFNSRNQFHHNNLFERENYILELSHPYAEIKKNYSKGRKWSVNQKDRFNLSIVEKCDIESLILLFKSNKSKVLEKPEFDFEILKRLVSQLRPKNNLWVYHVENQKGKLLGGAVFLIDQHRITYLFSVINEEGREKQAMSVLIDHIIQRYSGTNFIFDFEGSMIPEIGGFFKSFGAKREQYFLYQKNILK